MVNTPACVVNCVVTGSCRARVAAERFEAHRTHGVGEPDTEMGPALRPTPLSPACGPRRALDAWRLSRGQPLGSLALSPGARAGAGSVGGRMKSEDFFQAIRRFRDRSLSQAHQWGRQCGALPFHRSWPASPACRLRAFTVSTVRKLRHPKTPWPSFLHRAAFHRRVEGDSKISSSFRVLPLPSEEPILALDSRRMRLRSESGNGGAVDLSTFAKIASGQWWITQHPAAKAIGYPRSRLASNFSRRALSLMNPSASC